MILIDGKQCHNIGYKIFRLIELVSISAVPLYAGLRRFSEGRDFEQWTGDDSKALMKVMLPTAFCQWLHKCDNNMHSQHVGLHCRHCRPRTRNDGSVYVNIYGSLLHLPAKCNYQHHSEDC